jgi:uncharacterized protein
MMPSRQVVLITGATSGIGAAFAREFARQGAQLFLVSRSQEKLETIQRELAAYARSNVEVLAADLSTNDGIATVEARIKALPHLDVLVNNAGFGNAGCFAALDITSHEEMLTVHVRATMRLTHAALPQMMSQRRGAIINVSSMSAFIPALSGVSYTATKAYLVNFSIALSAELRGTGIRVQVLCPGLTHTDFHRRSGFAPVGMAPAFLWGTSEFVVQRSLRCLKTNRVVCVPGGWNRFLMQLSRWPLVMQFAGRQKRRLAARQSRAASKE